MAERVDPLGKRALFWAPGARGHTDDLPRSAARSHRSTRSAAPPADRPQRPRREPTGKRALFSAPEQADRAVAGATAPPNVRWRGAALGTVELRCATCGRWSRVSVLQFARLHLPAFLWRPGRGFARFMTCPACRRRAWISASWPASTTPQAPR